MLRRNAAALAAARPGDDRLRMLVLVAAVSVAVAAIAADVPIALALAGLLAGYAFRPEAERYYLEGFSDGLVAAALDAPAAPVADRHGAGVDGVRDGAVVAAGLATGTADDAPRPPSRRFRPVADREPRATLADAAGIRPEPGRAGHPVDETGAPVITGPRIPDVVPPARAVGAPAGAAGTAAGQQTGHLKRTGSLKEALTK